jgi:hypothetical protein
MCVNALENFRKGLDVEVAQNGRHIEHLMKILFGEIRYFLWNRMPLMLNKTLKSLV